MLDSRINRKKKKSGFLTFIWGCIVIIALATLFFVGKSFTLPTKAAADGDLVIRHLQPLNKKMAEKQTPQEYNGKIRKIAYLTFDDGPGIYTSKVLDILAENRIKGTFFMVGNNLKNPDFRDVVKRASRDGNYIGAHSMTHDYGKLYNKGQFIPEMNETIGLIKRITGKDSRLVRPPYGSMPGLTQKLRDASVADNLKIWDWTIDSEDWKAKTSQQVVENIRKEVSKPVEVILVHDIHLRTVNALPDIIKMLEEKGYEFETYDESKHFSVNFWKDNRL